MPKQEQEITMTAQEAYIVHYGRDGNILATNQFWSGISERSPGGIDYSTMETSIVTFEDIPDEYDGWAIDPSSVALYAYTYTHYSTMLVHVLDKSAWAPFDGKGWDDLGLPEPTTMNPTYRRAFTMSIDNYTGEDPPQWGYGKPISDYIWTGSVAQGLLKGVVFWDVSLLYNLVGDETGARFSWTQKPYIKMKVHTVDVTAVDLFPNSGYVDPSQNVTLQWKYEKNGGAWYNLVNQTHPNVTSASVELENITTGTVKQYTCTSPYTSITIPSEDLEPGEYKWTVSCTADHDAYGVDATATFTTLGEIPVAVINGPIDEIIDGEIANTFSWQYLSGSGLAQAKWEIEISGNGTQWTDQASGESAATSYTAPANSLPTGRVYWRVRVTDTAGNVSEWSDPAQIVVQAQVATPTITLVLNQARPVVQWQSSGQISYELDIMQNGEIIYSTGEVPGSATAHQVTDYLSPGSYMARLRIRDSALEQSGWGTSSFTLSFSTTLTPSLTAESVEGGVQLTPSGLGTANYLLRDGVPIAKISGAYIDYGASAGAHLYVLRAVDAADNFTDSAAVTGTTKIPRGARLAPVSDLSQQLELWLRRGENPTRSMTSQAATTAHHAAGREFPVVDYYEFSDNELSLAFSFRETANWEALRALLGKRQTMLYRDSHGEKCYLVVPSSGWERGRFSVDFDLSAVQVDYVEAISYDPPGGTV